MHTCIHPYIHTYIPYHAIPYHTWHYDTITIAIAITITLHYIHLSALEYQTVVRKRKQLSEIPIVPGCKPHSCLFEVRWFFDFWRSCQNLYLQKTTYKDFSGQTMWLSDLIMLWAKAMEWFLTGLFVYFSIQWHAVLVIFLPCLTLWLCAAWGMSAAPRNVWASKIFSWTAQLECKFLEGLLILARFWHFCPGDMP